LTVSEKSEEYAGQVEAKLKEAGVQVVWDNSANKIGYKIREARNARVPYRVVIGAQEQENGTVAISCRDNGDLGSMSLEDFIAKLIPEIASKL
jgi:threonyl-tRNA synthetase